MVDVGERPGACGGTNCHPLCKWEHVDDIKHTGEIVKYRILSDKMPRSVGFVDCFLRDSLACLGSNTSIYQWKSHKTVYTTYCKRDFVS